VSQPSYAVPERRIGTADRVVTVMLLIVLAVLAPIAGFMGLLTSMASDGCGASTSCNSGLIGVGVFTSALSPIVFGIAALVWVIVRWVRDTSTWWVPLVGALLGAGGWALGATITFAAVGG
jgi:hypothetical protein